MNALRLGHNGSEPGSREIASPFAATDTASFSNAGMSGFQSDLE